MKRSSDYPVTTLEVNL